MNIDPLLRFFSRPAGNTAAGNCGIVTAADSPFFDGVRLLAVSVGRQAPIAVFDLGLTPGQIDWCRARQVQVIQRPRTLVPESAADWQLWNKPSLLLASPFETTLWLDADAFVVGDLGPLFAAAREGFWVVKHQLQYPRANHDELYRRCPVRRRFSRGFHLNSGVVGFSRGDPIVAAWAEATKRLWSDPQLRALVAYHDEGVLHWVIESMGCHEKVLERPQWNRMFYDMGRKYPTPRSFVENFERGDTVIVHATGPKLWQRWGEQPQKRELDAKRLFAEAVTLSHRRQIAEARRVCRQLVERFPDHAHGVHLLGVLTHRQGDARAAAELIERAIAISPKVPEYHNSLGIVKSTLGDVRGAVAAFQAALELRPQYGEAWKNLATTLHQAGKLDAALGAIDRALLAELHDAHGHERRGMLLMKLRQWEQAAAAFAKAAQLKPDFAAAIRLRGSALEHLHRHEEAAECYRRLTVLEPASAAAHNQLGRALRKLGRYGQAADAHRRAIELRPSFAAAHQNLALALWRQGKVKEVIGSYRRAAECDPASAAMHSDLIYAMYHDADVTPQMLLEESRAWDARHSEGKRCELPARDGDPKRRLKVGYVSADFRRHTLERFIAPLLANHDRSVVEVFCYSSVAHPDATTRRLQPLAEHWRDVKALDHAALAQMIRQDRIDILVDLSGHMGGNRLPTFALKPAPVQVQMYFAGTSGLAAMDYRITDVHSDPPGMTEHFHSEKLVRLPACAWPYLAESDAPAVGPLPALAAGFVTFGSMNRAIKITDRTVELWSAVLRAVPDSRLLMLTEASGGDAEWQVQRFASHGISAERIIPLARLPRRKYLDTFNQIDICLDTFPYNGDTTTCDALRMGVPTLTIAGNSFHSRRGVSHLTNSGLEDFIAADDRAFVAVAMKAAGDIPRLARMRRELRERVSRSPLSDYRGYARSLEQMYGALLDGEQTSRLAEIGGSSFKTR